MTGPTVYKELLDGPTVLVRLFTSEGIYLGVFRARSSRPPDRVTMDDWQTPGAVDHANEWSEHLTIPEYRFTRRANEWRPFSRAAGEARS